MVGRAGAWKSSALLGAPALHKWLADPMNVSAGAGGVPEQHMALGGGPESERGTREGCGGGAGGRERVFGRVRKGSWRMLTAQEGAGGRLLGAAGYACCSISFNTRVWISRRCSLVLFLPAVGMEQIAIKLRRGCDGMEYPPCAFSRIARGRTLQFCSLDLTGRGGFLCGDAGLARTGEKWG